LVSNATWVDADTACISAACSKASHFASVGAAQGTVTATDITVWDQILGLGPTFMYNSPIVATLTYKAASGGVAVFNWSALNFFGLTAPHAGTQVTIVPEPGTLLLLAAGLSGLLALGRRRS
jgi:hypothetical protein